MKVTVKIALLTLCFAFALTGARAQFRVAQSEFIEEEQIEVKTEDGNILVAFDIEVGRRFVKSSQACIITPVLVAGGSERAFSPVILEGRRYGWLARERERFDKVKVPEFAQRSAYGGKETSIHYQTIVPYSADIESAMLMLNYKIVNVCGAEVASESVPVSFRITGGDDKIAIVGNDDQGVTEPVYSGSETYTNDFNNHSVFRQGKTLVDFDVFRSNGYDDLLAEVHRIEADPSARIVAVRIHTSASPEGRLANNARLARERSEVIARQLIEDTDISPSLIACDWMDENWKAFREELSGSGLYNIDEVRRIIDDPRHPDAKESMLRRLPNWGEIYKIFQDLRNCRITIEYTTAR